MAATDKKALTVTWPISLLNFVQQTVYKKSLIKISQLSQVAMEQWLKDNGYWDEYVQSQAEDIV